MIEPLESRWLLSVDFAELARLLPTLDAADLPQHSSERFGYSVAVDSDTAVVGAYADSGVRPGAGAAYVYRRHGDAWSLEQKLVAPDAQENDNFGSAVAISGETILVGAILHDSGGVADSRAAYVFTRDGTVWSAQQKLAAGDAGASDAFGVSVSIDGDSVVVGAHQDNTAPGADAGSAYVFTRTGGVWTQQQRLEAPAAAAWDRNCRASWCLVGAENRGTNVDTALNGEY